MRGRHLRFNDEGKVVEPGMSGQPVGRISNNGKHDCSREFQTLHRWPSRSCLGTPQPYYLLPDFVLRQRVT